MSEAYRFVYLSVNSDGRLIELSLGVITNFDLARLVVSAIRGVALTTGHSDMIDYALELTKALGEWAKKNAASASTQATETAGPGPGPRADLAGLTGLHL